MSLNDFTRTNALGPDTYYAMPQGASYTYAPTDTPAKEVILQSLALTRIPRAMRNMGWDTAAALMQRWFDSPAWEMPEEWKVQETQPDPMSLSPAQCDESIVKMEWAMQFERCRQAVEEAELLLTTVNAKARLNRLLKKAGWSGTGAFELGSHAMTALQMDSVSQVNFIKIGSFWDVLDDMYGALGAATLKIGVIGNAFSKIDSLTKEKHECFHIDQIGFYIRDHYDFNGFQYLGTWTEDHALTKKEDVVSMTPLGRLVVRLKDGPFAAIYNSDFREYRSKIGKGGDFIIYSDMLWKKIDRTIDLGMRQ